MCIILNGFTNELGKTYNNIRDIHFNNPGDILTELGSPVYQSTGNNSPDQVKIYRLPGLSNKALRLDKNFLNYHYLVRHDDLLVSHLQERQKDVLLTEFPTGIVTIEDKIIGQEIPFYEDVVTLEHAAKRKLINTSEQFLRKTLEILKIIRELLNAGIIYQDIHSFNFLYNNNTQKINLIDFDSQYIKFYYYKQSYDYMIINLKILINRLNRYYGIQFKDDFDSISCLEEIEEYLQTEHYKVLKRTN